MRFIKKLMIKAVVRLIISFVGILLITGFFSIPEAMLVEFLSWLL